MTTETFDLSTLEIIGYASTLATPTLPRVLHPVFRVRGADLVLFPPYTLQGTEVWKAHQGDQAEFEEFLAKEKLTRLDPPLPAKPHHDLWVSPEGVVAYAPKAEVKKTFEKLYAEHLSLAETKLAAKDFEAAARHAAVARSVDPGKLDPLIIRGVTEFKLADQSYYEFTRELAGKIVKPAEFDQLVRERVGGAGINGVAVEVMSVEVPLSQILSTESAITYVSSRGAIVMRQMAIRPTRFPSPAAAAA
ncbi:hypothetical protein [Prosthecobacter fluviatilis]|uniref:Uncharacterized protein n=1 Tax=Prosthecobacter fluviatilis TaxID=445931 RepID=A0ABW0KUY5_9BACT